MNKSVEVKHLRVHTKGLSLLRTNTIIHKCTLKFELPPELRFTYLKSCFLEKYHFLRKCYKKIPHTGDKESLDRCG